MKRTEKSFAEFLDERFKTALTFEEYSKDDRILVAKILASRGFLLTLTPKELNLPDDVFAFNTIKAMRGSEAVEELKRASNNIQHLSFKEVALLDPFHTGAVRMGKQAEKLLGNESSSTDPFLLGAHKRFTTIFGGGSKKEVIAATYQQESIVLDIEKKLDEFISFYKQHAIDLPPNFEDTIKDIWNSNTDDIQASIEQHGFNDMLILPGNIPLDTLHTAMTEGYNSTCLGDNFKQGGSFKDAKSAHVDTPRIVLVHKTKNLKDRPELADTFNIKGEDVDQKNILTLEDYLVFQRKYFEDTGNYLDASGWTWVATTSGARLVSVYWDPDVGQLDVHADGLEAQDPTLGARPSRSFF